ncbi:hypothetical protein HAX54_020614 [Datura stramonium]|uniref:Uncharacterized protein n=1 Tax=Datura stramonium TaxID=4076 RepID=A0ABS8URF8_DATST|nr:hypothetical protein [Datura stramonium]
MDNPTTSTKSLTTHSFSNINPLAQPSHPFTTYPHLSPPLKTHMESPPSIHSMDGDDASVEGERLHSMDTELTGDSALMMATHENDVPSPGIVVSFIKRISTDVSQGYSLSYGFFATMVLENFGTPIADFDFYITYDAIDYLETEAYIRSTLRRLPL